MFACNGNLLRVNLTDNTLKEENLDENTIRKYVGGRGLGAKILLDELKPCIDPFSPANKLIFATGILTGIPVAGNCRYVIMAKSPLTNIWGEANASGYFGPELKSSGYDHIIVEGKARSPVYLWIHDKEVEIKGADHLWGKITGEAYRMIKDELGEPRARIAMIGPAGENLVRYACIISELHRANGRGGMGAVMGSKKLKAIAVRGSR